MRRALPVRETDATLTKDLRTLAWFIRIYCNNKHPEAPRGPIQLRDFDLAKLGVDELEICGSCAKLLAHAFVKRAHCPFHPKPACKHCQSHCYQPLYREQIRDVMRFSGKKLVLSGRIDLIFKLLF
jgi:hypothetical protein